MHKASVNVEVLEKPLGKEWQNKALVRFVGQSNLPCGFWALEAQDWYLALLEHCSVKAVKQAGMNG